MIHNAFKIPVQWAREQHEVNGYDFVCGGDGHTVELQPRTENDIDAGAEYEEYERRLKEWN